MPRQPYPRFFYPNISDSVPTQQFNSNRSSQVSGQFEIGRSTWTEVWAFNQQDIQLFIDDVLRAMATSAGQPVPAALEVKTEVKVEAKPPEVPVTVAVGIAVRAIAERVQSREDLTKMVDGIDPAVLAQAGIV